MNPNEYEGAAIDSQIGPARHTLDEIIDQSSFLTVTTPENEAAAIDLIKQGKTIAKSITKARDFFIDPLKDQVKAIKAKFDPIIDYADTIERTLKPKIETYALEVRRKAREAEEADRREREAAQAEADRLQALSGNPIREIAPEPEIIEAPAPVIVPEKTTRTWNGGKSTYIEKKKGRVVDFAALPDAYKTANQAMIDRDSKDGKEIPGVEIYNVVESRIS